MLIQVESLGFDCIQSMFGTIHLKKGDKIVIANNAILYLDSEPGIAAFEMSGFIDFTLAFGSGVSAGIVANWLWQKLQGKALSINIDGIKVQINEKEIEKLLVEKMSLKPKETNE